MPACHGQDSSRRPPSIRDGACGRHVPLLSVDQGVFTVLQAKTEPIAMTFARAIDGLVYRFLPLPAVAGRPVWQRSDRALFLRWIDRHGWVVCDGAGVMLSRPWTVEKEQQGALPPEGLWVSCKPPKAYVYHLAHHHAAQGGEGWAPQR